MICLALLLFFDEELYLRWNRGDGLLCIASRLGTQRAGERSQPLAGSNMKQLVASLLLVARPFVTSFLLLVVRPGATSSVLAPCFHLDQFDAIRVS